MDNENVVCLLHKVNRMLFDLKAAALKDENIDGSFSQILTLAFLHSHNDEPVNFKLLKEKSRLKGPSLTSLIDNMEKKGLVVRVDGEDDKREIFIKLTDLGIEKAEKYKKIIDNIDKQVIRGLLEEKEIEELKVLLMKLEKNLENSDIK